VTGTINPTPIADLIVDGALSVNDGYRAKNSELGPSGFPFARAQNINNGFHFEGADRFPLDALDRVGNKISEPGDVVFTSKGTVGRFALVREDTPRFVYAPQLCFWRSHDHSRIDPRWLYYWMHSREFYVQYKGVSGQTDMAEYVSLGDQRRMHITLPPLDDQRAIAAVLGSLDDKIEVNRRTARVLEGIARTIFRSWFVDFDPVRGKQAASAPAQPAALPDDLAALFPTRLTTSPLGEIPEGWEVGTLGEIVEAVGGGTPSTAKSEYWDGGTHAFCTPKDMSGLSAPVLLRTERRVTDAGLAKINSGLLPSGTLVMSSRAPIGYLAITEIPVAVNQGIIAIPCTRGWPASFVLRWCEAHMDQIEANANGSTFQEISKTNFRPIAAVLPDPAVVGAFDRLAAPLHRRVVSCERQSATLSALRDTLLPKLISGELPVPAAEAVVAAQ
jgi:type I restriction enzyme S subunit